jgi:dipeptidyl-peptidase 4
LDISNLKFLEDENTIEFKIKSSQDVLKKDWAEIKAKNKCAKDSLEKKTFVFRYNINNQQLTEVTDPEEEAKRLAWANISPDSSKVVFVKNENLFWMDKENFFKAVKDEKDSTIVEHQLTKDGEKDYGYSSSGRGDDNVEEEKKKNDRKRAGILWSESSKQFIISRTDARKVKDLWVIHNTRDPRPTLETYKYSMPGEKEQPVSELYHYSFGGEKMSKLDIATFKDQSLGMWSANIPTKNRDDEFKPVKWLGDENFFYFSIASRDLKKIDICRWNIQEG